MNLKAIDISTRLRHPYLMPLLNIINNNTPIYPVPDGNIYFIKKDKYNLLKHINQLLLALYYVHGRTIILNNISPENIFYFNDSNSLRIGNFNYSTYDNKIFRTCISNNTNYLAPECLITKKAYTKSDIWMLGLTIFQVLYNYNPQEEVIKKYGINESYINNLTETIDKAINEIKDEDLSLLLKNILVIDYKKRFNAEELLNLDMFKEYRKENNRIMKLYQSCPLRVDFIDAHNLSFYSETVEQLKTIKKIFDLYNNNVYYWIIFNAINLINKLIRYGIVGTSNAISYYISLGCITLSFKLYFNDFKNNEVYKKITIGVEQNKLQETEDIITKSLRHKIFERNIYGFLLDINKNVNVDSLFDYVINTEYTGELGDYAYKFINDKMPSIAYAISNA